MRYYGRNITVLIIFIVLFVPLVVLLQWGVRNYVKYGGFFTTYYACFEQKQEEYWQKKISKYENVVSRYKHYEKPNMTGTLFREYSYKDIKEQKRISRIYIPENINYIFFSENYVLESGDSLSLDFAEYWGYNDITTLKDHDDDGETSIINIRNFETPSTSCRGNSHLGNGAEISIYTDTIPVAIINGTLCYGPIWAIANSTNIGILPVMYVKTINLIDNKIKSGSTIYNNKLQPVGKTLNTFEVGKIFSTEDEYAQIFQRFFINEKEYLLPELELVRLLNSLSGEIYLSDIERYLSTFDYEDWIDLEPIKSYSYFPNVDYVSYPYR